jgi:hypothetical protein
MTDDKIPIACTLDAGDYQARMAWIADLNARALASHRVDGLTLRLRYRADAQSDVLELARRETECCAFLTFDLQRSGDFVELAVTAPPEAEIAAGTLFNDFISGARSGCASACACA